MKTEIGSYEAKTKLPELLRQVKTGKSFTITNRGSHCGFGAQLGREGEGQGGGSKNLRHSCGPIRCVA